MHWKLSKVWSLIRGSPPRLGSPVLITFNIDCKYFPSHKHETWNTERLFSMPSTGPNWMLIIFKNLELWRSLYCLVRKFACPNWCCVILSFEKNLQCWFWWLNVFQRFFPCKFGHDSYNFSTLGLIRKSSLIPWTHSSRLLDAKDCVRTNFQQLEMKGFIYVQSPTTN